MTVAQLIKSLSDLSPDLVVVVSRDSEGNGFSECHSISTNMYKDRELIDSEQADDADYKINAVVLWP